MSAAVPLWVELLVAALLLANGAAALVGAVGLVRLRDFFQRMHPPALAYTLGAWPATVATLLITQAFGWGIAWRFMPHTAPPTR